jgi:hypothetical protein
VLLPPWWGKVGMREKLGRSAPLMRTPTPPSPAEGEGPAQRLTTILVPNGIALPPPRGEGVLTYPYQPEQSGAGSSTDDLTGILGAPCWVVPQEPLRIHAAGR